MIEEVIISQINDGAIPDIIQGSANTFIAEITCGQETMMVEVETEHGLTSKQSDWNETDVTSLAYIKNKPQTSNITPEVLGECINDSTAKTTPVDADMVALMDSEDSNVSKKFSWANIKTALTASFNLLYAAAGHNHAGVYDPAGTASGAVQAHENSFTHSNIHASGSDAETTTSVGTLINGATAKTTPVDADMVALMDSEASNVVKKLSWSSIKTALSSVFAASGHNHDGAYDTRGEAVAEIMFHESTFNHSNIHTPGSDAETTTTVGALINAATAKTDPVDADMVALMDSEASNVVKKLSWSTIKTKIKSYLAPEYTMGVVLDGQGGVISTGSKRFRRVTQTGTIAQWYLDADVAGNITFDIKRAGVSIIGAGTKPSLSSASQSNATPSGWTSVAVTAGDQIEWNVDTASTITWVVLTLKIST